MPTGIKPVSINSATSTYGLIHPHDSKIFPDIPEHKDNPSQLRLQHDCLAIDDKSRLEPIRLVEYMVSGPGGMDPEVEIDDDTYDECREVLSRILEDAYTQSWTFRRLMNHAYDQELHDVEQRWLLGAGENFGTTVTEEDLVSSEGRKVIALNLDDTDDDSIPECYESNDGPQPFDTTRSFIHEVVHALTHLQDKEDNNPRGPVVEYTNIILKEMGHAAPPRIAYEFYN